MTGRERGCETGRGLGGMRARMLARIPAAMLAGMLSGGLAAAVTGTARAAAPEPSPAAGTPATGDTAHRSPPMSPAFSLREVLSYPYPSELVASAEGRRIAWILNEEGARNVYGAEAPDWEPRRLTDYRADPGREISQLAFGPDGRFVVYVRGGYHHGNWTPAVPPNPDRSPEKPGIAIHSVAFDGGETIRLAEGDGIAVSPAEPRVAFRRGEGAWTVPLNGSGEARQLFFDRGEVEDLRWSPDGQRLAFVSDRGGHAFIGVFSDTTSPIKYLEPSTSSDFSPRWSPDGRRIAFVRRPGQGGAPEPLLERRPEPWSLWVADVGSAGARPVWESPLSAYGSMPETAGGANLHWGAGDRLVFLADLDGWPHLYAIPASARPGEGAPTLLTPGEFMVEHVEMARGGAHVYYDANAGSAVADDDRRHLFRVPVTGEDAPEALTGGSGLEYFPTLGGDGEVLAHLSAGPRRPPLPAVMPAEGGDVRLLGRDRIPGTFPREELVTPERVVFPSGDGFEVHAQLFRRDGSRGRRPAVIFVHGGPPRQMLLGWHYSGYYANSYAVNQYLASLGFVVLSVNYRLGIGYGWDFHHPARAGARGASEYTDVLAGARYLAGRPDVDPERIGIWGGSYGGYLTALALARDSDVFAAGVDWHGVHDWTAVYGRYLEARAERYERADLERARHVMWRSSPVSDMHRWESPVLLIHGDDDRNVRFSETVDLARRLESRGVEYEEMVLPNEVHGFLRHRSWVAADSATAAFLVRELGSEGGN